MVYRLLVVLMIFIGAELMALPSDCESCHKEITPGIVHDFNRGRMAEGIICSDCHGSGHQSGEDTDQVRMPDLGTCRNAMASRPTALK